MAWNPFANFGLLGGQDEETGAEIDPRYGVPRADVRQAQAGLLGNLGATLLAAGQRISPAQRAQLLGQLGPQMGQFSTDIYNAAQRRYQQEMLAEAKRKQTFAEEQARKEADLAQAEAGKRAAALQKAQEMAISMGTPTQIREAEGGEWATQAAPTREQLALQLAQAGGASAIPGIAQSLLKEPTEDRYTIKKLADGTLARVNLTTGESKPVVGPDGKLVMGDGASELSSTQFRLMDEQQGIIDAGQISLELIAQARALSERAASGAGALSLAKLRDSINQASPEQKALIQLESLIKRNVLSQLKATFGGNPSEAEGKALAAVEANINASPEVRNRSMETALKLAESRIKNAQARQENIRSGYSGTGARKPNPVDDLMNEGGT